MRVTIFIFIMVFTFSLSAVSQTFTPTDRRIGDTKVNYVNPELSPSGNYMIWIEVDTSNGVTGPIWQCGIDPNTGDLIPANGKGFSPFISSIYGRPADWGVDSLGLYYVGATFAGQLKFVRPTSPTSATVTTLSMAPDVRRRVFYPSQLPGVNKRFLTYILNDNTIGFSSTSPQNKKFELRFLNLDFPTQEIIIETQTRIYPGTIPMDVIVPRWIKGSHYLTYGFKDGNGKAQAREFNAMAPTNPPVVVTNDLANKIDGYPVLNKINGNQYFMSGINATDSAYFYKRTAYGELFVKNEVVVPPTIHLENPAFNQSHEPFMYLNQLYSTFQINENGGDFFETTFNQPGEIWLTTIDNAPQTLSLLSEFDSTLSISEPEPYIGNGKVWVFYTAVKIEAGKPYLKRQFQLRRCETPMNFTASLDAQTGQIPGNYQLAQNYPNPFNPGTCIHFTIPQHEHVCLTVGDIRGREVGRLIDQDLAAGDHAVVFNASGVPAGLYFYQLKAGNFIQTKKMVVIK